MRLQVVAVGQRMPAWADEAWKEYARRFPPELRVELREVKAEPRHQGRTAAQCMALERTRIEAAVAKGAHLVALDERGDRLNSQQLAQRLGQWMGLGRDVALLIGGPDGLAPELKAAAQEQIRLTDLTLPHAMARVVLCEALYRAWSLNAGHPYHRE